MQVTIAAGIYPPDIGGPATYAYTLAAYLSEHGDTVSVIAYGNRSSKDIERDVTIYRIDRSMPKLLAYLRYLFILWRVATDGVIYAQGPLVGGLQAFIVSRLRHVPYLVKITGDYAWEQASVKKDFTVSIDDFQETVRSLPLRVRFIRMLQRMVVRRASDVIVPSVYLSNVVKKWGITEPSVLYNFFEIPKKINVSGVSEKNFVISVGRLVPWKGFQTLIEVWPEVIMRFPQEKLLIIGSGPEEAHLHEMIIKNKMADFVHLLGKKSRADLIDYYSNADCFILNSSYEGLSHTILESMYLGAPIAVSGSGGNAELIQDQKDGLLFPYNNREQILRSILTLLSDKKTAHQYAANAKLKVAHFDRDAALEKITKKLREYA